MNSIARHCSFEANITCMIEGVTYNCHNVSRHERSLVGVSDNKTLRVVSRCIQAPLIILTGYVLQLDLSCYMGCSCTVRTITYT